MCFLPMPYSSFPAPDGRVPAVGHAAGVDGYPGDGEESWPGSILPSMQQEHFVGQI